MYYMTVSISSVGYGDITPSTDLGRLAAMCFVVFAVVSVPQMTNELIEKMAGQSIYARLRYYPKTHNAQHVVVCGNLNSTSVAEFFAELFHADHEIHGLHCVLLQPSLPTKSVKSLLKDPQFAQNVTYLEGSALNDNDLKRADIVNARAIFIMTNKFSSNPDEEDAKTILEQFSIQKYIRLNSIHSSLHPLFCLQLIRPENKRHLVTVEKDHSRHTLSNPQFENSVVDGHKKQEETDVIICLNEIKMGVIAKSVMFPVSCYLLLFLISLLLIFLSFKGNKHFDYEFVDFLHRRNDFFHCQSVRESRQAAFARD
jgi:hypothetical protein